MHKKWKKLLAAFLAAVMLVGIGGVAIVPEVAVEAATVKQSNMKTECMPYNLVNASVADSVVMGGVTYSNAIAANLNNRYSIIGFNLGGLYDSVSFEIGHIDGSGSASKNVVFNIYKDGELSDTYNLSVGDIAKTITCDTTNVTQFELELSHSGNYASMKFGIGALQFESNSEQSAVDVEAKTSNMKTECMPYNLVNASVEDSVVMGEITYNNAVMNNLNNRYSKVGFNLCGLYDSVSFEVGHIDGSGRASTSVVLNIYKDGALCDTYTLSANDIAKKLVYDTTNVKQFEVELSHSGNYASMKFGIGALQFERSGGQSALDMKAKESYALNHCYPYNLEKSSVEDSVVMGGITYNDAISANLNNRYSKVGFNLAGLYDSVSFEVGHIDGSGRASNDVVLNIYKDGEWSETYTLSVDDIAKKFVCDTTDVAQFEIELSHSGNYASMKFGIGALFFKANLTPTTNLKAASAGEKQVKLTWDECELADGYLIYGQKNGVYGYVGMTTTGTTYTDKKALDTDYNYYWVFPYQKDADGKMYPGKCPKYVYAKGVLPAVTNLKASSVKGAVKLTWSSRAGADGYLIYGIRPGGEYEYIGMRTGVSSVTFSDTKASKTDYNFYWVYPFHYSVVNGQTKMIVGGTAKYTYGRAL